MSERTSPDIVERLRRAADKAGNEWSYFPLVHEAANEIAMLRPYVEGFRREETRADRLDQALDDLRASAAQSVVERATEEACRRFSDEVEQYSQTHIDELASLGVKAHPAGKITVDRGNLRYAFIEGARFAAQPPAAPVETVTKSASANLGSQNTAESSPAVMSDVAGAGTRSSAGNAEVIEARRLLAAEDARQDKLQEILETIREQIRLEIQPENRPDGLFKNIQDAVYAMRGRTRLMDDAAITHVLNEPQEAWNPINTVTRFSRCEMRGIYTDTNGDGLFAFKATHWRPETTNG